MAAPAAGRSVAAMTSQHFTRRRVLLVVAGAALITAVSVSPLSDEWFFAIALLGPLLTGLVVGLRDGDLPVAAATWVVAGLVWLVSDWIAYGEDRVFHLVLAAAMAGIVALGALAGRGMRRVVRTA